MFRTDPLTKSGVVDTEFFASEEYKSEQESLLRYLKAEGFDHMEENFSIDYRNRTWYISLQRDKRKRKN